MDACDCVISGGPVSLACVWYVRRLNMRHQIDTELKGRDQGSLEHSD